MKRCKPEKMFIDDFLSWDMDGIEDLTDFNRRFESLVDRYEQKKEIFFGEEIKQNLKTHLEIKATRKFIKDLKDHLSELKNNNGGKRI